MVNKRSSKGSTQSKPITDYFLRAAVPIHKKRKALDDPEPVTEPGPSSSRSVSEANETRAQTPFPSSSSSSDDGSRVSEGTPPSRKKQRVSPQDSPQTSPSSLCSKADLSSSTLPSDVSPSTPPDTVSNDTNISPGLLDVTQKTAFLIAQIKANAEAHVANLSSPSGSVPEFRDVLSDSDDDDLEPVPRQSSKPSKLKTTSPPVPRYSFRKRASHSPEHKTANLPPAASHAGPSKGRGKGKEKEPARFNPLISLLKEKATAEKLGKGEDVFLLAEQIAANRQNMRDADGDFDMFEDDGKYSHSLADDSLVFEEADRQRLFGEEAGKGIGTLLQIDRQDRVASAAEADKTIVGVPLWTIDRSVAIDNSLPQFPGVNGLPLLEKAFRNQDYTLVVLLVSSAIYTLPVIIQDQDFIDFLCDLALHPQCLEWTTSIFTTLLNIWERCPSTTFSPRILSNALNRLGANSTVLSIVRLSPTIPSSTTCDMENGTRAILVDRLIRLVTASARTSPQPLASLPDFFLALVLISMDPTVESSAQRDIITAFQELCCHCTLDDAASRKLEVDICNRLIRYASPLAPANQFYLLQTIGVGSEPIRRLARWIGLSLLAGTSSISDDDYRQTPPLPILLNLLAPDTTDVMDPSKFQLTPETDYIDFRFNVKLLGFVLTEIEIYVAEDSELQAGNSSGAPSSPSKSLEKPRTLLELLRLTLDSLHGKIIDTRAADLNKSRAKAALQELAARLGYQRDAAVKKNSRVKRSLKQYFPPPDDNPFL